MILREDCCPRGSAVIKIVCGLDAAACVEVHAILSAYVPIWVSDLRCVLVE